MHFQPQCVNQGVFGWEDCLWKTETPSKVAAAHRAGVSPTLGIRGRAQESSVGTDLGGTEEPRPLTMRPSQEEAEGLAAPSLHPRGRQTGPAGLLRDPRKPHCDAENARGLGVLATALVGARPPLWTVDFETVAVSLGFLDDRQYPNPWQVKRSPCSQRLRLEALGTLPVGPASWAAGRKKLGFSASQSWTPARSPPRAPPLLLLAEASPGHMRVR